MPNIKSAKKRVLVNDKKTEQNKIVRSEMKTAIKKVDLLIKENKIEELQSALNFAFKSIDIAQSKNIIHANNAANKKAKLSKKVFAITKNAVVEIKEEPAVAVAEPVEAEPVEPANEAPVKKPRARKTTAKKEADAE